MCETDHVYAHTQHSSTNMTYVDSATEESFEGVGGGEEAEGGGDISLYPLIQPIRLSGSGLKYTTHLF